MSMKETELDKEIEELQSQKIELHLKEEEKKITDIKCVNCHTKLRVKPEEVMEKGTHVKSFECPKCGMINNVEVVYRDIPENSTSHIRILRRGFAWKVLTPSKMSTKHIRSWIREEDRKIRERTSQGYRREEMIMLRALNLALNRK